MHVEYWWSTQDNPHELVFSTVNGIKEAQRPQNTAYAENMALYGNSAYVDFAGSGFSGPAGGASTHRVTLNIIQSMCDTVTARVAKAKPKPTYLTQGGNWSMQRKAKLLERFTDGQFYSADIYRVAPKVFLDACVFGTGAMKIYEEDSKIKIDRVIPAEIIVDDIESRYAKPRQMFQRKLMAKDVLAALFPGFEDKIREASEVDDDSGEYKASEQIEVIESWHLKSSKGSSDGRHSICIENCTLLDEPWERDDFPFVFIRWTERMLGFWGQGLAEQLTGIQVEINKLLKMIQRQIHLATPKVFVEHGSQIVKAHLNNEIWGVIEYLGTPPQFVVPKTVAGEVFSHLDRLYTRAYEISGVSQLAAQSKKPAGLDSGVALREFQDIETERFMIVAQNYEQLFLDAAEQMIALARDISSRGDGYAVISHGDRDIESIDWKEIDLEKDQYVMKIYPTSLLPTTPAAKLQKVIEMTQAGMISQHEARGLLDYPDLEAVNEMATASSEGIKLLIEQMVEKGIYNPPEPFMNLSMAIQMVQSAYLRAKINQVPEDRLDLLRRFIQESVGLLASTMPQPMAPMPGQEQGQQAPSPETIQ